VFEFMSQIAQKKSGKKIGIALGSGGSRGFAHLGVLLALQKLGIEPDIVTGVSVGAIIGAFYVCHKLHVCEEWARGLSRKQAFKLMDFQLIPKGGFVKGSKIIDFFAKHMGSVTIESLDKPFLAVATNLITGQEIWLKDGALTDAIRASMAFPGLLPSFFYKDQWMVDGGLVNPVPVSPCRALGADFVIAIDLNQNLVGRRFQKNSSQEQPGIVDVTMSAINIMQDRITRSRMSGDPADILLAPRLGHMGLLDFDLINDAIEEGFRCVEVASPMLDEIKKNKP